MRVLFVCSLGMSSAIAVIICGEDIAVGQSHIFICFIFLTVIFGHNTSENVRNAYGTITFFSSENKKQYQCKYNYCKTHCSNNYFSLVVIILRTFNYRKQAFLLCANGLLVCGFKLFLLFRHGGIHRNILLCKINVGRC